MKTSPTFQILLKGLASHRPLVFSILFFILLLNLAEVSIPKILEIFVNEVSDSQKQNVQINNHLLLFLLPGALLLIGVGKWIISYFRIYFQAIISQKVLQMIRKTIYERVHQLSFRFHDHYHSGNLISNIVEDIRYLSQFLEAGLFPFIETFSYIFIMYTYLFFNYPQLAFICCCIHLLTFVVSFFILKNGFSRLMKTKEHYATMVENFTENMEGQLVTRALGQKKQQKLLFHQEVHQLHQSAIKETVMINLFHQLNLWVTYFIVLVGLYLIIDQYQQGSIVKVGALFSVYYILYSFVSRIRILTRACDLFIRTIVTAKRLDTLLSAQEFLPDNGTLTTFRKTDITIKNLSFKYQDQNNVLSNINMHIPENQLVALVGFTGSGKSTLLSLLARFYDSDEGSIEIGDKLISHYQIPYLRKNLALVFQETFLFSDSIFNNIRYGKPDASLEEVKQVAKIACIDTFINKQEDGYETQVGEKGVTLSGGQKQRIGLARALLLQPKILFMDDCTSALDSITENQIVKNLKKFCQNTTTIFTTQRITSLTMAKKVFVMKNGTVVEEGTFKELNQNGHFFNEIFSSQLKDNHESA